MSNLRIAGLASGMDTDTMVQSLMKVERLKVDRYEQSKQIALWRQEAYTSMNKMFANFILNSRKDMGLTRVSSTGFISNASYTRLDYVRKATSSNETAATVSATSEAVNGSYTIEVKKLATSGSYASKEITPETNLKEYAKFTLSIGSGDNKKTKEIEIKELVDNNAIMEDIVQQINSADIGVTAFYDEGNRRLFMQTMETGSGRDIVLTDFVKKSDGTTITVDPFNESIKAGQDAEIIYNGVTLKYSNNNFTLNGLNIQLKSEGVSTTMNVDTNIDGIMEKIEKLINDYNELVDKSSKVISEKRYSNYHPLSQEEKKAMHEDDVKLWMEKAKSGMLNRDETVNRTLQTVRNELYKTLENGTGSFNHITQIGISTEKYARGTTGGKLQIDKDKLRTAIMEDPEGVMELLFKESNEEPSESSKSTKGAFTRVYDSLIDGMKSIIDKSGPGEDSELLRSVKSNILLDFVTKKSSISDLDKEVLDTNKRIDDLNVMLARKENSYYAKFANMEKMLQQMYSQSNWLSQQFVR